ncbi:hypothetical protein PHG31p75 [Aeromonas phage 31]|uniref:Uncharacterized protein PHG31ORF076c n=2 Tax=Biquartavirus TaxID=1912143 RepID=Q56ET6_9CAUD|nr:hypothetical protein PHG31p75 [Aeromonas phage 31]APU00968.1 hypothetical protein [Aeromonas phage 31.2]APU01879.1 hypothetical protein [Aeromonas phage L9-6]APU02377.1 hypothetical protein [Aeromonas phage SW69-9]UYD59637.1 hypothetical protein JNMOADIG_00108 [Aeromonas phage avDM5]UYD60389.1 hypothetical protein NPHMPGLK_00054 [Aeromonas phage avDM2]
MELEIIKVYLESKIQLESLFGNSVGEVEIFKSHWMIRDGFVFIGDPPIDPDLCVVFEKVRYIHKSNEIHAIMVDDYVSETHKIICLFPEKKICQVEKQ